MLYASIATVLVGGFALVADALVVSDEEAVEELADDLTQAEPTERVGDVLQWIDTSREPVTVQHEGRGRHFDDGEDAQAADTLADALQGFEAPGLEVIQRSVDVDGDRATVAVRARTDDGVHDATFQLRRQGQGWLVTHATAR